MIHFKNPRSTNVVVASIDRRIFLALALLAEVLERHQLDLVVTSMNDSTHRVGSWHYQGKAVDVRSWHIPRAKLRAVVDEMGDELFQYSDLHRPEGGASYRLLLEGEGTANEHLHFELIR